MHIASACGVRVEAVRRYLAPRHRPPARCACARCRVALWLLFGVSLVSMPGGQRSPVKLEIGRRLFVLWDGDDCYYPGEVMSRDKRTGVLTILYSDGEREELPPEALRELSIIALPPDVKTHCAGLKTNDSNSPVCGEEIDLSARLVYNSKHVVCTVCSTAYHFSCAGNLKSSLVADKNARPPRLTKRTARDVTWFAEWRCPRCELKAPVKKEPSFPAKKSKASGASSGAAKVSKSIAPRSSVATVPRHNVLKTEFSSRFFRGPDNLPIMPGRLVVHDVAPEFGDQLVQFVPACEKVNVPSSSLSYSFPSDWKRALDVLQMRYALDNRPISTISMSAVPADTSTPGFVSTEFQEDCGSLCEGTDQPEGRALFDPRAQLFRPSRSDFGMTVSDAGFTSAQGDIGTACALDPPLSRGLATHDSFCGVENAANAAASRKDDRQSASEETALAGVSSRLAEREQLSLDQSKHHKSRPGSRKRPRSESSLLRSGETSSAGGTNLDLTIDAGPPRVRRKGGGGVADAVQASITPFCAFCHQRGDIPECEGEMLGPYTSSTGRTEYAHRNCLAWAPDTVELLDVTSAGETIRTIEGYEGVFPRSRKKTGKCIHCHEFGASLSCMFMKTKCCKPMHFRCALLAGASILVSKSLEYYVFCPTHKAGPYYSDHIPHEDEHVFVQTPVKPECFNKGNLCVKCGKSNFDTQTGPLLDCASCGVRAHCQCMFDDIDNVEGAFAVDSHQGKFRCADCATCFVCSQRLVSCRVDANAPNAISVGAEAPAVVTCVSCKMPAAHASCLARHFATPTPAGRKSEDCEEQSLPISTSFRCERCRRCAHCGVFRVPFESWHESICACARCSKEYDHGNVCPICDKAYREDDDCMILCDGCEKWLHGRDCCGLTEAEFKSMDEEAPFYCSKCKPIRKPRLGKSKGSLTASGFASDEEVVDTVLEEGALVHAEATADVESTDEEVDYHENYIATHDFTAEAMRDVSIFSAMHRMSDDTVAGLAPLLDLCRRCGSAGQEELLRFCSDCGDALHVFCLPKPLPQRNTRYMLGDSPDCFVKRFSAGGLGPSLLPWRCDKCAVCHVCEVSDASSGEESSKIQDLLCCDHCGCYVHDSCMEGGCDRTISGSEGVFLCSICNVCELCLCSAKALALHDGHLLCNSCWTVVRTSKPCPFCEYPAPLPSVNSTLSTDALKTGQSFTSAPLARRCRSCESLVHLACDSVVVDADASYVCRNCRDGGVLPSCADIEEERGLLPANFALDGVKKKPDGDSNLVGPANGTTSALPCPPSANVQMPPSKTVERGGTPPNNSACSNVTSDSKRDVAGGRLMSRVSNPSKCSKASLLDKRQHEWTINAADDRVCELCKGKEEKVGSQASCGRLLPWSSSGSNLKVWWIHVACAIWSSGVSRVYSDEASKVATTCFLVADRHYIAALRSEKECEDCGMPGATVQCSHEGCMALYHYPCAMKSGCRFQAKTNECGEEVIDCIELKDLSDLIMTCKDHCGEGSEASTVADEALTRCTTLSSGRRLNFNVPIRFSQHRNIAKPKESSMLRTGGLTVLRYGQLVAHSSLFFEKTAIVPTSFRACRRHWSLKHPGRRCTLLMDISGGARSGPLFSIRFSDDPEAHVVAPSAAAAWERVSVAVEQMRLSSLGTERMTGLSLILSDGVSVFGLANCDSSVAGIEALPHSFLLRGRHEFIFGDPVVPSDFPFRLPKMSLVGRENASGSARLEGYVPRRHPLARISAEGVHYENIPSGERFQIHVAMGLGGALENAEEEIGLKRGIPGGALVDRGAGSLPPQSRERGDRVVVWGSAANLPHSMQFRAMLKTWKRRTVVLRSGIEGWGVFATEDIAAGDMVIEYMGQLIRPITSDEREAYYDSQGIGCYMFEVAPGKIVDATKTGNRARYINHSCDPNCYSRTVAVEHGRRVIVIFALREIKRGEELCYDYQFPLDAEDRVACACGAAKCKGYMN